MSCFRHVLAGALACLSSHAAGSTPPRAAETAPRALSELVQTTLIANPELQAARSAVAAAQARLGGAALPLNNPELTLDAERTGANTYTAGISQTLDWHDKRGAHEAAARAALEAAQTRVAALESAKADEVLTALGAVAAQTEATALAKRRVELLERSLGLVQRRQAAGDAPQAELELARLTLAEASMQHAGAGAALIAAQRDYTRLTGTPPGPGLAFPERLPALPEEIDGALLAAEHPQVRAALATARVAREQIRVADRERRPDPTVGVRAGRDDRDNLIGLSLTIPLSARNDHRGEVDAAQAEALQAEQEAQQALRDAQARIEAARDGYRLVAKAWGQWVAQGRASLQQHLEGLERQWRAGDLATAEYLLQVRQALDTQGAGAQLHGDLWAAWVEWLAASGALADWLGLNPTSPE